MLGVEEIIKVIVVARYALDIDSLWMLLFIDKGKCQTKKKKKKVNVLGYSKH